MGPVAGGLGRSARRLNQIDMKQKVTFALLMGIVTTGIISFSLIAMNVGFSDRFLTVWLKSWASAYVIVIPAILFIGPKVQRFSEWLYRK